MDGEYKWILQIKDAFFKRVWLCPLKDKTANSVKAELETWCEENGDP
jgi:hypothetical protein